MKLLYVVFALLFVQHVGAQQVIPLYAGAAPGSESWNWEEAVFATPTDERLIYNVTVPTLTYYRAADSLRTEAAMIVAPGGAFHLLAIDNEGIAVARFLNGLGIDAFVLKYRLARLYGDDPLQEMRPLMQDFQLLDSITAPIVRLATQDGIRALEWLHRNATDLAVDTSRIGMMGFSAGATLTMSVLLSAPSELKPALVAPFYLYKPGVIGADFPAKKTPMFIAAASDDGLGFAPHSIALHNEWIKRNHPTELHLYESGGHGFGMTPRGTASDQWPADFISWLHQRKWL